tara:strand:- start:877 stop:1131 length:255 start_codon:yes stop_codon:yes gene_type:complete
MITTNQYTVGTTAVKVVPSHEGYRNASIHQNAGTVYLGGTSAVTTSTGFLLDNTSGPYTFQVGPLDEVWAIATISHTVTALISI